MVRCRNLALVLVISLLAGCDRKNEAPPQQSTDRAASLQPQGNKPRNKILEANGSNAGAEVVRRLMERENTTASPGLDDPEAMMREYATASNDRKAEILTSLGADGSPQAWGLLCRAAGEPDQGVRLAALDALAVHAGGDPSPAIEAGLSFPDEETRALAATLLHRRARNPEVWGKAAMDPSPTVRVTYLSAVESAPNSIKIAAARRALSSGNPQLRLEAASVLGGAQSKEAADILIGLLDDPQVSDVANEGLFFLLGRSFGSASEAREWLATNTEWKVE